MAEPARKPQLRESTTPARRDDEDELSGSTVLRVLRRPNGRSEIVELPLTREIFLNPQKGDKFIQGDLHSQTAISLWERLHRRLTADTVAVLFDVKHLLGLEPGRGPVPDVSVFHGLRPKRPGDRERYSVNLRRERVVPSLVLEVVSGRDPELRRADEVDKVDLYSRTGIAEYLLVDLPQEDNGWRYQVRGLRLSPEKRYQPIPPDGQGRILSQTTGLLFGVAVDGRQIDIFDTATGERLLRPQEEAEKAHAAELKARKAELKAQAEAEARAAAESEVARLRAEIERLRNE
jgi:Uma2 family endonuclease